MHTSIPAEMACEFINVTPLNPLISKCQIKVCYVGEQPNRNRSIITKEVATQMANSLPGSPIVGFYNEDKGDFEEHNREIEIKDGQFKLKDATRPYGFVDLGAKCWFQKFIDDGENEHEYLMTEGYLWTGQYPECKRVLESGNNQSMELAEEYTNATWTKSINGKPQFFIINETIVSKLCILGEDYEPCFEGASIGKVQFSFDEAFNEQMFSMMKQVTEYLNKGGEQMSDEMNLEVQEVEAIEATEPVETPEAENIEDLEFAKKAKDEDEEEEKKDEEDAENKNEEDGEDDSAEETDDEDEEKKKQGKKDKYNLDEIPEYMELVEKYSALEQTNAELNQTINKLKDQITPLVDFKAQVEKQQKEELINSFYMLSDAEKQDVRENIDKYSLDDIEAKLSIICVRNKVSFNLEDDNKEKETVTTFNLEDSSADDLTPAWVKAVLVTEKNLKK